MESKFKLALVVAAILVLAVASVALTEQEKEEAAPVFRVENANLQLGTVVAGQDAVATYVFHNDTEHDIKIIRAKPS